MDLLYTIKNLLSGNRGLETNIEKNLRKTPDTPDEIDEYLRFLRNDLESVIEHQEKGQYLLVHIRNPIMKHNPDESQFRPEYQGNLQQFAQMLVQTLLTNRFAILVIVVITIIARLVPQPDAANEWLMYQGVMVVMFMAFNVVVLGEAT